MLLKHLFKETKRLFFLPFYQVYENILSKKTVQWKLPKHIGIILDGNRRWARKLKAGSVIEGHSKGADKLDEVIDWCFDYGIEVVTIWIFSTDNFNRSKDEVDGLMDLIERKTVDLQTDKKIFGRKVKVNFIGRIELLPDSLQNEIQELEKRTASHDAFCLNVAIAYGGREEIVDSFQRYINDQKEKTGKTSDEIISELEPDMLNPYFYTSGQPDPDLIIRTSGEVRLSGFLLWQSTYSEFYFCDSLWPSFRRIDFLRALRSYHLRGRRFGQ